MAQAFTPVGALRASHLYLYVLELQIMSNDTWSQDWQCIASISRSRWQGDFELQTCTVSVYYAREHVFYRLPSSVMIQSKNFLQTKPFCKQKNWINNTLLSVICQSWSLFIKVRLQVLMTVSMKMTVFWAVVLCSLVEVYQRFRGTSLKMSVKFYQTAWCNNPEDRQVHSSPILDLILSQINPDHIFT
jgi:hypothetical protein